MKLTVTVPDLGGFKDVAVIDVLVKPGQAVDVETPLITVESDKATMDIPSTSAGTVESVAVKPGDKVSTGSPVVVLLVGSEGSNDLTAPRAVLRAPEPFGGEPYLDTVPMQPMPEAAPATAARVPDSAAKADAVPACCRQARAARLRVRSRRAGRRSRRLYGRLPCRRPWPARRTGRALPDARRRLPQCRLHPVQGAAARCAGHRGCAGDVGARRALRRSADRCGEAARLEGFGRRPAHGWAAQPGAAAQGGGGAGHGVLHLASRDARG